MRFPSTLLVWQIFYSIACLLPVFLLVTNTQVQSVRVGVRGIEKGRVGVSDNESWSELDSGRERARASELVSTDTHIHTVTHYVLHSRTSEDTFTHIHTYIHTNTLRIITAG